MAKKMENEVKPIVLTNTETGAKYTLEFNRESVKFAEQRGFNANTMEQNGTSFSVLEDLFYYSFRMHHKSVSYDKAMSILYDELHGFPEGMIERLIALFTLTFDVLVQDDEEKNVKMTVEF